MRTLQDRYITMTTDELTQLLVKAQEYKYFWVFDSDDNRDGQGEWHCDVEFSDEVLGKDSWGDGEESFSFDEMLSCPHNESYAIEQAVKSVRKENINEWGVLDKLEETWNNFKEQAQEFITQEKEKKDEQN